MSPRHAEKEFVVIGMGRFGTSLVKALYNEGKEVIAVEVGKDQGNEEKLLAVQDFVTASVIVENMDEISFREAGIANADHVIISMGDNLEKTILAAATLKDMNIKNITVKSNNDQLTRILMKLGITDIVQPEKDSGKATAKRICHTQLVDYVELGTEHAIVSLKVNNPSFIGKTLVELNLRGQFKINVLAIKRNDKVILPEPNNLLFTGDMIVVFGKERDITELEYAIEADE